MVTVNAGLGRSIQADLSGRTVGSVLQDANIRAVLGIGDTVQGLIRGAVVPNGFILNAGDELIVEGVAASKA
jgi:hypothetical protein